MQNRHCPLAFDDVFQPFDGLEVTSDPGDWREYQYADSDQRLCHYFLTTDQSREAVIEIYQRVFRQCQLKPFHRDDPDPRTIAVHYRKFIEWQKAPIGACVDLTSWLSDRTGVRNVVVASDDEASAGELEEELGKRGMKVRLLSPKSGMTGDLDRDKERTLDFVRVWRTLTFSRWAVSNAISSTVLDASRALGNEVWTFGDLKSRTDQRCEFFKRFGFDWLLVGSTDQQDSSALNVDS